MSDLVGEPEDRFSQNEAHMILIDRTIFPDVIKADGGLKINVCSQLQVGNHFVP